uniref:OBG-type G domain-containing protein n=1 Tax=Vitrella brassicaformis TaxID=1169539 RepID=A0A7S1KG63_9ALVE|mmetsp:Transcript_53188/g.133906  ORF Transcript_53188/g.133906 Transcript_53188/m.133906 type:complete len:493 (+) Transcript_53188:56-1534(+)
MERCMSSFCRPHSSALRLIAPMPCPLTHCRQTRHTSSGASEASMEVATTEPGAQVSRSLVDKRRIRVRGGRGGDGVVKYIKHAKHIMVGPGWPSGGAGGQGGSVFAEITTRPVDTILGHLKGVMQADPGEHGWKNRANGASGAHKVLTLPRGCVIWRLRTEEPPAEMSAPPVAIEREWLSEEALVEEQMREMAQQQQQDDDDDEGREMAVDEPGFSWHGNYEKELIADMNDVGERILLARGGRGGRGNTSMNPHDAEKGEPGESVFIELELKSIADAGLVGFPNAGKSTLLGAISRSCPKIAPYPFTTLAPHIGRVEYADGQTISVADLPGLVEGASINIGLGHEFLRHIERTMVLVYVVDMAHSPLPPLQTFEALRREVAAYSRQVVEKVSCVVANKCDIRPDDTLPKVDEFWKEMQAYYPGVPVIALSARLGQGVRTLVKRLRRQVAEAQSREAKALESYTSRAAGVSEQYDRQEEFRKEWRAIEQRYGA